LVPSAVVRSDGLEADTMDVSGALGAAVIGEEDLIAGRWDGARVRVFAADWRDSRQRVELGGGTIGTVELRDGGFTAELAGATAALDRPVSEETSPECRAELGDPRCRVPARRRFARVMAAAGAELTLDATEAVADAYGGGRLRWFAGPRAGLVERVARSDGDRVTLRRAVEVEVGALCELVEGCDKSIATCAGRFGNAANFRGEPYLPGVDLLTRYPGA
jgi:uncharacterized phage protein (TIGR02218 family)